MAPDTEFQHWEHDESHVYNWIPIVEQPALRPRKIRVVVIGAGFAGLTLAYKYRYEMQMNDYVDLAIYEKNVDVGGTWLENKYPGATCDVPAHVFTFPFAPNPNWTSFYAEGSEIWQYIRDVTNKFNLDEHVKFGSKVLQTVWNEQKGKWHIKIERDNKIIYDEAEILVSGSGITSRPKMPAITGLHSFKGKLVHSARWDNSLDWKNRRVAVIGNGASAIQMLPQIQKTATHVTNFIRSPTWIPINFAAGEPKNGKNFKYTEAQKKGFREHPKMLTSMRKKIEHTFNAHFSMFLSDSPLQADIYRKFRQKMASCLNNDPDLCAKLIPTSPVGCRRLTPGNEYLEVLQEKNVTVNSAKIHSVTSTGIRTNEGSSLENFDIIICATGFEVSFAPFWNLVGSRGFKLAESWSENPEAYLGICAPSTPNYFVFSGPNSQVGQASFLTVMDWTADYILKWIRKMATQNIKSIVVSQRAIDDYNVYTQEFLRHTVWTSRYRSWYKNNEVDGKVTAMYGGSILHYKAMLEEFRTEDFEYQYHDKNRFSFMGNGLTDREVKNGLGEGDLAFYLKR